MTNPKQALKMAYRVPCTIKPPQTWQAEHKIRQYRLISAIDADLMSEQTAKCLTLLTTFCALPG